jgi:polyisoprenyl-teichoic acid--peptidoglycan teichoic acid transferase
MKRTSPIANCRLSPLFATLLIVALLLTACQPVPGPTGPAPAATNEPGPTVLAQAPATAEPVASPEPPTATLEPSATPEPTEVPPTETPAPPTETPEPTPTPIPTATVAPRALTETDNYLVLGIDPRPGDRAWRTDTIMVVAVDHQAQQIGIFNIPRDLWVQVPGLGAARINQADYHGESAKYPGGGPALVGKIVEDTFGVPIHHWVRIKQEGLVELVDALGGVDVTLNCALHELTPHPTKPGQWEKFELPAGVNRLDGAAAKKFATFRYNSNDFYRGQRQQQLIWAIKERALQLDAIPKLPQLWTALQHTFQTDLGILDVIRLARLGAGLNADQVHGLTFSTQAIVYAQVGEAQVLKIGNKDLLMKELAGLWTSKSISEQGKIGSNATCPTPTVAPTATITPLATMEPLVTPTP